MRSSGRFASGVLATLALISCAAPQDRDQAVAELQAGSYGEQAQQHQVNQRFNDLPPRPAGEVVAEGASGSLTALAALAHGTRAGTTVRSSQTTEADAFARLCAGEIDLVNSTRAVSDAEWQVCAANGLGLVQLQVAAEAVVLVAGPETEWAGGCLTTGQVEQVLTDTGTTSWSQLGFDDVPLEIGGPVAAGRAVAGLRADHRAFASGSETRDWTAGRARHRLLAEQLDDLADRREVVGAQLLAARRAVAGAADPKEAVRVRNHTQALYDAARARYLAALDAQGVIASTRGNLAVLSYADHAALPDLEPFAIGTDAAHCVIPSPGAIADGEYPLTRPRLLTTTARSWDRPEVQAFLEFYLSGSASLAAEAGLVPMSQETVDEQLSWLGGDAPVLDGPDEDDTPSGPEPHEPVQEQPAM